MKERPEQIILTTREETLDWIAAHDETFDCYSTPVKSIWLCDELDRFEKDGYVYNRQAQERICAENNIAFEFSKRRVEGKHTRTEGGLLGSLIYDAQKYRRVRQLLKAGWTRANQDSLSAFVGKKIRALANGELSGEIVANVKRFNEKIVLCPLRSRNKAYADYLDWWIQPLQEAA